MFTVKLPSSETYRISVRPSVFKSLAQELCYFNLHQKNQIFFNGEAEVSKLIGGEYNGRRGSDLSIDVGYNDKIFVEFESEPSGFNDELDSMRGVTTPLLWQDPLTGSSIRPIFEGKRYTITINKFFKDRVTAESFRRRIRSAILGEHLNTLFDLDTHFPIPMEILACYQEIYNRLVNAKAVDTTDSNFIKWFRQNSLVPTDYISNLIGNNDCLVFKQQMADNGIDHGDVQIAKVNKGRYIGQYEVSWSYSYHWNEHTEWELTYPIQVYQQPMNVEWMPDDFDNNKRSYPTRRFLESKLASMVFDYLRQAPVLIQTSLLLSGCKGGLESLSMHSSMAESVSMALLLLFSVSMLFTIPLILERRLSPVRAMWTSFRLFLRGWPQLLLLYAVLAALFVLAMLPLGLGLIWMIPFYLIVNGIVYRDVCGVRVRIELSPKDAASLDKGSFVA